jgi:hypothetical protein
MNEDKATNGTVPVKSKKTRERTKIAFPYGDLEGAVEVVFAINNHGGNAATLDQLVDWMNHDTVTSGAFRNKIAAAKLFGLTQPDGNKTALTPLGKQLCDPITDRLARAHAFLKVPLYRKIFQTYQGRPLPADKDLETVMQSFGVPPMQADRARQSFQRSAEQAKVFNERKDRLVLPSGVSIDSTPHAVWKGPKMEEPINQISGEINPLIAALIEELPQEGE